MATPVEQRSYRMDPCAHLFQAALGPTLGATPPVDTGALGEFSLITIIAKSVELLEELDIARAWEIRSPNASRRKLYILS